MGITLGSFDVSGLAGLLRRVANLFLDRAELCARGAGKQDQDHAGQEEQVSHAP
jgi:hypothetical protein